MRTHMHTHIHVLSLQLMNCEAGRRIQKNNGPIESSFFTMCMCVSVECYPPLGLRIKETKEVYEGEVTELTPCETENPMGGYGKTISHVIIGLKTGKGTKQLKVRMGVITMME